MWVGGWVGSVCCWSPVIPWSSLENTLNHMTVSRDMFGSSPSGHRTLFTLPTTDCLLSLCSCAVSFCHSHCRKNKYNVGSPFYLKHSCLTYYYKGDRRSEENELFLGFGIMHRVIGWGSNLFLFTTMNVISLLYLCLTDSGWKVTIPHNQQAFQNSWAAYWTRMRESILFSTSWKWYHTP